ncbi:MAG: BrnT family toxin [Deltaproteobacteria bacterium]|nr:BrnT family toxin [Deltaproteobacteria bacterium]
MADESDVLSGCTGFEWDEHNTEKNWQRHRVTPSECEEIFFNRPLVVTDDIKHSEKENRFYALGNTDAGRPLFAVFTVRGGNIRVISARDMNRKERMAYESHEEEGS